MKVGDLIVTYDRDESNFNVNPPKIVRMAGLLIRPVEITPFLNRYERSKNTVPGWEVLGYNGLFRRQEKSMRLADAIPERIQDMIRARDFVTQKIKEWEKSNDNL